MPVDSPKIQKYVLNSPLDMQGIIIVFLRILFENNLVVNNRHWERNPEARTIEIEVSDKFNQEKLTATAGIYVNIGTLAYNSTALGSNTIDYGVSSREVNTQMQGTTSDIIDKIAATIDFSIAITVYSTKTESFLIAYKLMHLVKAFASNLMMNSNIIRIGDPQVRPPVPHPEIAADIYAATLSLPLSLLDEAIQVNTLPILSQIMGVYSSMDPGSDTAIVEGEFWGTEMEED